MEVKAGESRVVVELGFEEIEEVLGCERGFKEGIEEISKLVMVVGVVVGEGEGGERGGSSGGRLWWWREAGDWS